MKLSYTYIFLLGNILFLLFFLYFTCSYQLYHELFVGNESDTFGLNDPDTYQTTFVSPDTSLFFFDKTEHHISCCSNNYRIPHLYIGTKPDYRTSGCPCKTKQQQMYLANRGNNSASE